MDLSCMAPESFAQSLVGLEILASESQFFVRRFQIGKIR